VYDAKNGIAVEGSANNNSQGATQRSFLSIKNGVQVIKRKEDPTDSATMFKQNLMQK